VSGQLDDVDEPAFLEGAAHEEARVHELLSAIVGEPHFDWEVPPRNRHYYYDVCAMDDHREKNPDTWYPALPGNFVLVPPDQYF